MDLASAVAKYLQVAGGFGPPVQLSLFGLSKAETERIISAWDEDYQISRYMLLSRQRDEALVSYPPDARVYLINGFECSHLTLHADVQKLL